MNVPTPISGLDADKRPVEELERLLQTRFPATATSIAFGELTLHVSPSQLIEALEFARDELACALLADLSAVHWPAGETIIERQPATTGWPEYRVSRDEGVIEVLYVLRSLAHNDSFRLSVGVPDDGGSLPSATRLFRTAGFHEREVYDMFGVTFEGHPNLTRILMPDDWVGHPQRKDYPLGGVDIPYANDKFIPPPHERSLREVVE